MCNATLYAKNSFVIPKTELYEDTRNLVLSAAARGFAENGYIGASTEN